MSSLWSHEKKEMSAAEQWGRMDKRNRIREVRGWVRVRITEVPKSSSRAWTACYM